MSVSIKIHCINFKCTSNTKSTNKYEIFIILIIYIRPRPTRRVVELHQLPTARTLTPREDALAKLDTTPSQSLMHHPASRTTRR